MRVEGPDVPRSGAVEQQAAETSLSFGVDPGKKVYTVQGLGFRV